MFANLEELEMKKCILSMVCIAIMCASLISCGANNSQVPEEQIKYDILSTQETIAAIQDENVEWHISHLPNSDTHSDSLKIYLKDSNNIVYENDSYRYTYDSQSDLWTLNEDRVKPWCISMIYNSNNLSEKWIKEHKINYDATQQSPSFSVYVDVNNLDFTSKTIRMHCRVEMNDKFIDFGENTYEINNLVEGLGIYPIAEDEILVSTQKNKDNMIDGKKYLNIELQTTTDMFLRYGSTHYPGFLYPMGVNLYFDGLIELEDKIKLDDYYEPWDAKMTTRKELESK